MNKNLVIVESPAKAKTINQYLGDDYIVKSSFGHIRDLPVNHNIHKKKIRCSNKINKKKSFKDFPKEHFFLKIGIDPFQNWKTEYIILKDKKKIISEIKNLAKVANHIYLATDLDREGEAIAWHLQEIIGGNKSKFSRIIFNEITKKSIEHAFKNPSIININRVYAQQARRFMDRIVGYMLSPLLWKKISRNLSAGRVQSVAVRIIVDKEKLIKKFSPEEYWKIHITFSLLNNTKLVLPITHYKNKPLVLKNEQDTQLAIKKIQSSSFKVTSNNKKIIYIKPNPPFITSTLQQSASNILGFSVKKTMILAQKLYEYGYITYMRTDSTHVSQYAINMVREYINDNFDKSYLPQISNIFNKNDYSQESHEAIRPVCLSKHSNNLNRLTIDLKKLYKLIWSQFIASQMTDAGYQLQIVTVQSEDFQLNKKIKNLFFDGWKKVTNLLNKENYIQSSYSLSIGDKLLIELIDFKQYFSKSPIRFSESSLIKELEKKGIGRPSTYSLIISTIQDRGYVCLKRNKFYATKIGEIVTNRLMFSFKELMNYDFTAKMEFQLDQIANSKLEWKKVLDDFFNHFYKQFKISEKDSDKGGMKPNFIVHTSIKCKNCKNTMVIRIAKTGMFLSCLNYLNISKIRCKYTINLIPEYDFINTILTCPEIDEQRDIYKICKLCSYPMDKYFMNENNKLHVCSNYPDCSFYQLENGFFPIKDYIGQIVKCEICYSEMNFKVGKFGKFLLCTKENCNNTRKILNNGKINIPKIIPIAFPDLICKNSNAYFVLRNGVSGIFFAANNFPISRETRTPYVNELIRFKHLLPPEIIYLTKAPVVDNEGNQTILRFDKIKKIQYIGSKKNEKFTTWKAFFKNNEWVISNKL